MYRTKSNSLANNPDTSSAVEAGGAAVTPDCGNMNMPRPLEVLNRRENGRCAVSERKIHTWKTLSDMG